MYWWTHIIPTLALVHVVWCQSSRVKQTRFFVKRFILKKFQIVPAEPIGYLGHRLRAKAPTCKRAPNNNNILYNNTFSSEKKKKNGKAHPKKCKTPPKLLKIENNKLFLSVSSNHIIKSLAFSKKKSPHPNILWIKPLYHISLRKPMFITWNVERERKRDTDFPQCKRKYYKSQKKERRDK